MNTPNAIDSAVNGEALPSSPERVGATGISDAGNSPLAAIGRWARILIASAAGGALGLLLGVIVASLAGFIDFRC